MVESEWDAAKNAWLKAERGISFEELQEAALAGGVLADLDNPGHAGQRLLVIRSGGTILTVVEMRGERLRFVTAYASRKWRKKYGP